jgi:hypothetical protein
MVMKYELIQLIKGYDDWITAYWNDQDLVPYFLTFHFKQLGAPSPAMLPAMQQEIGSFYTRLLTRTVPNPRRHSRRHLAPKLFAFPDAPVAKFKKTMALAETSQNAGRHYHGFLFMPPLNGQLRVGLRTHIADHNHVYCGDESRIQRIDVRSIANPEGGIVDYACKHIKRGTFGLDDIIIFPRSSSEITRA